MKIKLPIKQIFSAQSCGLSRKRVSTAKFTLTKLKAKQIFSAQSCGLSRKRVSTAKFSFAFAFIFIFLVPQTISAQSAISITAIPPRLELEVRPGATLQETLKIKNDSQTEMVFKANIADFIVNDNQGTPIAVNEKLSGRWSLASWITVSPRQLVLKPDQTQTIDLIITLPKDALPGGHYAMVTYTPSVEGNLNQPPAGTSGGSSIKQKVGTLIYLNVIGDTTESLNLKEFKVAQKFSQYGPIQLWAEIENLGDIHLKPKGSITVTNLFNQTIASSELEPKNIFPFTSRTYQLEVPGKWRLGRYSAKIEAVAGSTQVPVHGFIYFWIIPYKELALLATTLISLIVIAILIKHKRNRSQENQL